LIEKEADSNALCAKSYAKFLNSVCEVVGKSVSVKCNHITIKNKTTSIS